MILSLSHSLTFLLSCSHILQWFSLTLSLSFFLAQSYFNDSFGVFCIFLFVSVTGGGGGCRGGEKKREEVWIVESVLSKANAKSTKRRRNVLTNSCSTTQGPMPWNGATETFLFCLILPTLKKKALQKIFTVRWQSVCVFEEADNVMVNFLLWKPTILNRPLRYGILLK